MINLGGLEWWEKGRLCFWPLTLVRWHSFGFNLGYITFLKWQHAVLSPSRWKFQQSVPLRARSGMAACVCVVDLIRSEWEQGVPYLVLRLSFHGWSLPLDLATHCSFCSLFTSTQSLPKTRSRYLWARLPLSGIMLLQWIDFSRYITLRSPHIK